jgi:hypothetical protein
MDKDFLVASWMKRVNDNYGGVRFKAENRRECIQDLADTLIENDISFEEAKVLETKIVNFLVTKKGLSGGKSGNKDYTSWKPNTINDFRAIVADAYQAITTPKKKMEPPQEPVTEKNPLIEKWGRDRYKDLWGSYLSDIAHNKRSSLHFQFLDEFFG